MKYQEKIDKLGVKVVELTAQIEAQDPIVEAARSAYEIEETKLSDIREQFRVANQELKKLEEMLPDIAIFTQVADIFEGLTPDKQKILKGVLDPRLSEEDKILFNAMMPVQADA